MKALLGCIQPLFSLILASVQATYVHIDIHTHTHIWACPLRRVGTCGGSRRLVSSTEVLSVAALVSSSFYTWACAARGHAEAPRALPAIRPALPHPHSAVRALPLRRVHWLCVYQYISAIIYWYTNILVITHPHAAMRARASHSNASV